MAVEYKIYVGDTPLVKVDCVTDITLVSGQLIKYKKPGGSTGSWPATVASDPNTSKGRYLEYTVSAVTILDESGDWKFQAYVAFSGGGEFHGETATQHIYALFD